MRSRPAVLRTLAAVVVVFAAVALWKQWQSASREQLRFSIDARWLTTASLLFLGTYLILIEMWRRVLAVYGSRISLVDAAHVWFVANLGKYVPGKIWQVTASTAMMTQLGTRAVDAGSAAAVIAIVNVLAGFAIVLAAGFGLLRALGAGYVRATIFATAFLIVAFAAAPWIVRIINRLASRALRRPVTLVVPGKAIWISLVGCAVSWCVYGLAFQLLVRSLIGHADGRWTAYLAAYTLSYLVGYLTLFAPGGLGARELALSSTLRALNLATPAEAALITVASRLWLTVLEVVPGVLFLPRRLTRAEVESRNVQETPPTPR